MFIETSNKHPTLQHSVEHRLIRLDKISILLDGEGHIRLSDFGEISNDQRGKTLSFFAASRIVSSYASRWNGQFTLMIFLVNLFDRLNSK